MTPVRLTDDTADAVAGATHFVLGGNRVGLAIAEQLQANGHAAAVVDETYDSRAVPGVAGDPTDPSLLAAAGLASAEVAIAGTASDARNLLIAHLVRAQFEVPRVLLLVSDPERLDSLAATGHEPVCVTTALAGAVTQQV
jgi:Trk K+ transport system NAD-binding subunit